MSAPLFLYALGSGAVVQHSLELLLLKWISVLFRQNFKGLETLIFFFFFICIKDSRSF